MRSILSRLLANVVMAKKANGKWRMCVDFTDLNRACPKDSYPLPWIDTLVDSMARHKLLSFMDAFSSYNQIKMSKEDQERTSFVTSQGLFCYKVMSFGLKNIRVTYQRLMKKMFTHQIGRNVQVYVDDMLVKSLRENDHLNDLQETSDTLRSYKMKLNPSKCMFGITTKKFLGFMVSQRSIKVNPEKVRAIMELGPSRTVKEVQSLNGKNRSLKQIRLQSDGQMSAILPHSEKIVRVDGRVPEGIQGLKEIPFVPTTTQPIQARRRTLPLHSGFASSSQCGLSKRRGRIATTRLFYK